MKRKFIICLGIVCLIGAICCMSGCIDDIGDGLQQAGSFLKENKEPIESGLNELQDTLVDVGEAINKHIKDDNTIQTTKAEETTPATTTTAYMMQDPSIEIQYGKGMKY